MKGSTIRRVALGFPAMAIITHGQLLSSQSVPNTDPFLGKTFDPKPLLPKTRFYPNFVAYHRDSGNTRIDDYAGPTGCNVTAVTNNSTTPAPLLWDSQGRLTAGTTCSDGSGGRKNCIASLDSESLAILGSWEVPEEILFNGLTYMSLKDDLIVVPGPEYAYELERNGSEINLSRKIDLHDELPGGSILPNMAYCSVRIHSA